MSDEGPPATSLQRSTMLLYESETYNDHVGRPVPRNLGE